MTLYFIGLGLCSPRDLSMRGLEAAKRCSKVYVELYTSPTPSLRLEDLQALLGKEVKLVGRGDVEGAWAEGLMEEAARMDVALLTPGDPFIATTHNALRLEALRRGVKVYTIHAASVASAIPGATGLSFYRFGRAVTLVRPEPGYAPEAAYDVVKENLLRGLHTLLLLDQGVERGEAMSIPEALRALLEVEGRRGEGLLTEDALVVAVARVGCDDMEVRAGRAGRLLKVDMGPSPHSLVVPGLLHFLEEEALKLVAKASEDDLSLHRSRMERLARGADPRMPNLKLGR